MTKKTMIEQFISRAGSVKNAANLLKITSPTLLEWRDNDNVKIPIKRCVQIEKLTEEAVTRKSLCPDDWHEIWPELIDK